MDSGSTEPSAGPCPTHATQEPRQPLGGALYLMWGGGPVQAPAQATQTQLSVDWVQQPSRDQAGTWRH